MTNIYSGKLYIIGGEGSKTAVNIYNIENDVWSSGAESSIGRKYAYSCVYDGIIYVFGGDETGKSIGRYNTLTNQWLSGETAEKAFSGDKGEVLNGKVYLTLEDGTLFIYDLGKLNIGEYITYEDENGIVWRKGSMTNDTGLTEANSSNPLKIEYPFAIVQIDSYRNQTLAIYEAGQVIAWGEDYYQDF